MEESWEQYSPSHRGGHGHLRRHMLASIVGGRPTPDTFSTTTLARRKIPHHVGREETGIGQTTDGGGSSTRAASHGRRW